MKRTKKATLGRRERRPAKAQKAVSALIQGKKKTKGRLIREPRTAKALFTFLRRFFTEAGYTEAGCQEGERAWDVLTALRGPDNGDFHSKASTTAVIRHALLGGAGAEHGDCFGDEQWGPDVRKTLQDGHFRNHAKRAFDVLGLSWYEVN